MNALRSLAAYAGMRCIEGHVVAVSGDDAMRRNVNAHSFRCTRISRSSYFSTLLIFVYELSLFCAELELRREPLLCYYE